MANVRVADEVWIATALLHRQHPDRDDFSVGEIVRRAEAEKVTGSGALRPGVQVHAYLHCVANKAPNPGRYRMLVETSKGRRRLFKPGDPCHPLRASGKNVPAANAIPPGLRRPARLVLPRVCRRGRRGRRRSHPVPARDGQGDLGGRGGRRLCRPAARGLALSRIFWDTNLFVYLIEDRGERAEQVVALREWMIERDDELMTSALTLGEVLVKPMESGDEALMRRYEHAIGTVATVLPFDDRAAPRFAEIRRDRSIRAPDAIQLACASAASLDLFVTNDDRLSRKHVRGIQFIRSLATAIS